MDTNRNYALSAFRLLFRPIARILLRAGVNWKDLAEVGKGIYVDVATEDFGIRGRPTNISRVAILTGFTRREVRRLRDLLEEGVPDTIERMNYATRVLSGWYQDEEFTDDDGHPAPLSATGSTKSFEKLCARYSGDVAATTMLKELRHVGAVAENEDGKLLALSRYYMPVLTDPDQMLRSGDVVADLANTVAYNLHRSIDDPSRFERRASNSRVPASAVPAFRDFIEREGQKFLERVDAWLSKHEDGEEESTANVRLGVGTYWIESKSGERVEQ